jgi:hypothetical protein
MGALLSSVHTAAPTDAARSLVLDDPQHPPIDPADERPPRDPKAPPPGVRAQFGSTRDAAKRLAMAHVDLAKAEASAIGGQIARTAALIGVAIGLLIMVAILLFVGSSLFLGEWLLGSIGWGVLHGVLAFVAIALACCLAAVGISGQRIARAFATAVIVGLIVGLLLAFQLPNRLYTWIGDQSGLAIEPAVRPLVVGLIVGAIVGLVLGLAGAIRASAPKGGASVGGLAAGLVVGAFTAITFEPRVGAGIGIAVGYVVWMVVMGADIARTGVDTDALKARFYPTQTIETSKETLEWLQKRMPPGIG